MEISLSDLIECLDKTQRRINALEQKVKRVERQRDSYRDQVEPGWRQRELREALDGELRLRQ